MNPASSAGQQPFFAKGGEALEIASSENEKLRADLKREASDHETCEGCGAQLFPGEDYVSNDDSHGCWHTMTDIPDTKNRPCFAYRADKPDGRRLMSDNTARSVRDEIKDALSPIAAVQKEGT